MMGERNGGDEDLLHVTSIKATVAAAAATGAASLASNGDNVLRCLIARKRQSHKLAHVSNNGSSSCGGDDSSSSLINSLGCLAIKRNSVVDDEDDIVIVPPYEYCSVSMLNQLRQGNKVDNVLTDKGGTIKNILQSSKSFVHYLVTYPLKNTFRGYIQISPFLAPRHIALPFHHATRLFSLDVERDRRHLHHRDDDDIRSDDDDDVWPDPMCAFYFETNQNFALVLKRDPCIHNGSVVSIERVYVYERTVEHNDSVHISPFILKHLNADFDGDAVTIMILRGLESAREVARCLSDPFLFGDIPRFTFCQSMIFWIFRALAFDDAKDEAEAVVRYQLEGIDPSIASDLLHSRLDVWRSDRAKSRAIEIFGPWYEQYARILSQIWRRRRQEGGLRRLGPRLARDWRLSVWRQRPVLDLVYASAVRRYGARAGYAFIDRTRRLLYRRRTTTSSVAADKLVVITEHRDVYCLENWIMVHSGAKGTPRDLVSLRERTQRHAVDDDSKKPSRPQTDLFRECSAEQESAYLRYLDDFVVISKHVPKSSYFASGLKWVTQRCSVRRGDLYMHDRLLLADIAYYMKGINKT